MPPKKRQHPGVGNSSNSLCFSHHLEAPLHTIEEQMCMACCNADKTERGCSSELPVASGKITRWDGRRDATEHGNGPWGPKLQDKHSKSATSRLKSVDVRNITSLRNWQHQPGDNPNSSDAAAGGAGRGDATCDSSSLLRLEKSLGSEDPKRVFAASRIRGLADLVGPSDPERPEALQIEASGMKLSRKGMQQLLSARLSATLSGEGRNKISQEKKVQKENQ